jgi:thiamine biosynthesis lipoprotein
LYALVYFIRRVILLGFALVYFSASGQMNRFSFSEQKMGSPLNIIFFAMDSVNAHSQAKACFKLVDSLNHIFSNYDSNSELSYINNNAGIRKVIASPLMWELLLESKQAFLKSNRAYNIAMGPLTTLWRKARQTKHFPTPIEINHTLTLCDFNKVILNHEHRSIYLSKKGMQLDFGGIGKGYIAQKVADYLKSQGITMSLVDAGGDIVLGDSPPLKNGWSVGVNQPEQSEELLPQNLLLHNVSVATSGDVYQFIENKGKKYSHIIDPSNGYGVTTLRNVTVIANNGTNADWLATACSILPIAQAKKLAIDMNAELLISEMLDNHIQTYSTKGFQQFWKK